MWQQFSDNVKIRSPNSGTNATSVLHRTSATIPSSSGQQDSQQSVLQDCTNCQTGQHQHQHQLPICATISNSEEASATCNKIAELDSNDTDQIAANNASQPPFITDQQQEQLQLLEKLQLEFRQQQEQLLRQQQQLIKQQQQILFQQQSHEISKKQQQQQHQEQLSQNNENFPTINEASISSGNANSPPGSRNQTTMIQQLTAGSEADSENSSTDSGDYEANFDGKRQQTTSKVDFTIEDAAVTSAVRAFFKVRQADHSRAEVAAKDLQLHRVVEKHPKKVSRCCLREGVVIGQLDPFVTPVVREFLVPMFDNLLEHFLHSPGSLRTVCKRTRCEIHLTRRILNQRLISKSAYVKFFILTISGPSWQSAENCDRLLQQILPPYRLRREHRSRARCTLFVNERVPDNTKLCFNQQRTGATQCRYGYLLLQSPLGGSRHETKSPWQLGSMRVGNIAFNGEATRNSTNFFYSRFSRLSQPMPLQCTGTMAVDEFHQMRREKLIKQRQEAIVSEAIALPIYESED